MIVEILCIFKVLYIAITSLIMRKKSKLLLHDKKENHAFLDYDRRITAFCLDYRIFGFPERGINCWGS